MSNALNSKFTESEELVPLVANDIFVVKRDGSVVLFDLNRIVNAINKAMSASGEGSLTSSYNVARKVYELILQKHSEDSSYNFGVEEIQDMVERQLILAGYVYTAKGYILYRASRAEERARKVSQALSLGSLKLTNGKGKKVLYSRDILFKRVSFVFGGLLGKVSSRKVVEEIIKEVEKGLFEGIHTSEVDTLVVFAIRARIERDPLFSKVAAKYLLISQYKSVLGIDYTKKTFPDLYREGFVLYIKNAVAQGRLDPALLEFDLDAISKRLVFERDENLEYLGLQTLVDRYFLRDFSQNVFEVPQYFWMRVSMGLCIPEKVENRTDRVLEFYDNLSKLLFVSSTPTLFHSGTLHPQLSSCYLTTVEDDLGHIFKSIGDNAQLSKWSGGLGNDWSNIRATGSLIKSTNVPSQGVIPFLKIADATTAAINRSGKRRGATCAYLETWHLDIESFLELRKNTGDDRRRTHDMNTANWIPDLFMKRVREDGVWTLFSPEEVSDLHHLYGSKFEKKYRQYEKKAVSGQMAMYKQVQARDLWRKMITMLFETGHPWITFKDPCNVRSPQQHVGVVHSSNLCTEITLNTSSEETAVCNLGSVNLAAHINEKGALDKRTLKKTVITAMRMLDNVVDINYYPTVESRNSNLRHRPVGLGIMGLSDALFAMDINFDSEKAVDFSDMVMEYISYWAIKSSSMMALEKGRYSSYEGSLWSRGVFPFDTLAMLDNERGEKILVNRGKKMKWLKLKAFVAKNGMRNSNCMAIAPTATISNISGCFPTIEPIYNNLYVKANQSGDFTVINQYLVSDLKKVGLWNETVLAMVKQHDGSIESFDFLPGKIRDKYKTAFEIDPIWVLKHASVRGKWIDQSQSVNLFVSSSSGKILSDIYMSAWMMGLKTTYYLRSLGASSVEKSSISMASFAKDVVNTVENFVKEEISEAEALACKIENGEDCEACQ